MSNCHSEFMLDFTVKLQKHELPTYQKVSSCYAQTLLSAPLNIMFRQTKPGVFILQTFNEKDTKKIEGKFITYEYKNKKQERQINVHFKKLPKYKFYSNAKWIKIDWVQDSGLRFAENSIFDNFLGKFGTIIEPTVDDRNELGMLNGRKKARLDLDKGVDIDRISWIEAEVMIDGVKRNAKGKVKVFYQDQPVLCKNCQVSHVGKCPEKIKEEELLKVYEEERANNTKTMIIMDSQGRCMNEHALNAKTHVASGAKIGHIGNVMQYTDLDDFDNIILNVGLNNINAHPDTKHEDWIKQVKCEVTHLASQVNKCASEDKEVRIFEIADCPMSQMTQNSKSQRLSINEELKGMVDKINEKVGKNNVKMIKHGTDDLTEEEAFSDGKHFSPVRTAKLVEQMENSLNPGTKLIVKDRPKNVLLTTSKFYSQVYSTYRFGCGECTRLGHSHDICQVFKSSANSKGVKRAASLGTSPEAKKIS